MDSLFINLKVLSKIQENNKLSLCKNELIIDSETNFLSSIYRWFYNESRDKTLIKIQEIIKESIKCGEYAIKSIELEKSNNGKNLEEEELREQLKIKEWENIRNIELRMNNIEVLSRLVNEMSDAINGINNLKKTYIEDATLCARFQMGIEMLERGIKKFENYLTNLI